MTLVLLAFNLAALLGLAFIVWRKQNPALQPFFWPALALKLAAGIGLGLIYQQYYANGDTFYFFDQAKDLARIGYSDFREYLAMLWQDNDQEWKGAARSAFFVKLISLIAIVSRENYWITSLWFSILSFFSSLYLVNVIVRYFPGSRVAAAAAFLFFPSVVFWGSGVIKESVGIAGLLLLAGIYLKIMKKKTPGLAEWIAGFLAIWVVWNLKYYWIAVFLPVTITSWTVQFTLDRFKISARWAMPYWMALFLVICLGATLLHPNFYPERILQVVVENHKAFVLISDPVDLIHYVSLRPTLLSVILNSPWALVSGIFRPFLWEADNLLKVTAAMENAILLLLFITSIRRLRQLSGSPDRLIVLSLIAYVLLLCIFLALSTPNLGSLSRYKVGFMPFLVFLVFYRNPMFGYRVSWPRRRNPE